MANEWTRSKDKVIEVLKEETLARIRRHYYYSEGEVLDAGEVYDKAGEQFIRGIRGLINDMRESVIEDIEQTIKGLKE